jgi:RNA polymerase I-specific transcription initiation factor RRN7
MSSFDQCPQCNSRRWTDNGDGNDRCLVCGYIRARLADTLDDEEDFGAVGKTTRKKREKINRPSSKYFRGSEQKRFHLLAHQLILRKQLWWLIQEKKLPVELEELVRALWEQRINVLSSQLDAGDAKATFSSGDMFTSGSDTETSGYGVTPISLSRMPKLQETLVLCYMGLYILRQPIFVGDLISWVQNNELLYYQAFDTLPEDMRERMDPGGLMRTRRKSVIKPRIFQRTVYRLIRGYHKELGMELPALNFPLYLYRIIQDLALPLEVYPAVKKLAGLIGYAFEYPTSGTRSDMHLLPDRKLAALVVVAVKLMYPFDSVERIPSTNEEPAATVVDWDKWIHDRKKLQRKFSYEEGMKVTEVDALYMENTQLDRYMEWFAENMLETRDFMIGNNDDTFTQHILAMFPVDSHGKSLPRSEETGDDKAVQLTLLKNTQSNLIVRKAIGETHSASSKTIIRPGSQYRRYRSNEEPPEGNIKSFLEATAELLGVEMESLLAVVFKAELSLEKWAKNERARSRQEIQQQDLDSDSD